MKKTLILMAVLLLGTACSKAPQTSAKFAVTIGGMVANGSTITQVVITGQSVSGKRFSRVLTNGSDSISLDLSNESWNFLAMAWEGSDLTGKVRCAVATKKLDGQEVDVPLVLTNAKCFDGTLHGFTNEVVNGAPNFRTTNWRACRLPLTNYTTGSQLCDLSQMTEAPHGSVLGSVEVAIVGGTKFNGTFVANSEKLASSCAPVTNLSVLSQRYPIITNSSYFFPLAAIAYPQAGCATPNQAVYSFLTDQKIKPITNGAAVAAFAQFTDSDICSISSLNTINAIGLGTPTSPHALCNLTQLKHWQENFSSHAGAHVNLMSDLDLITWIKAGLSGATPFKACIEQGSTFLPLGFTTNALCADQGSVPYTGFFHGQAHRIKNLRIELEDSNDVGFFRNLGSSAGNVAHVRFHKPSIRGKNFVGVAFGNGTNAGNKISNIQVTQGEVEGDATVGMITGALPSSFAQDKLHASGRVRGNGNNVGGIAGTSNNVSELSFDGIVESDMGVNVGGIIGLGGGISQAVQAGLVKGANFVGGIAGQATGTGLHSVRVNGAVVGTLDSGSGDRHGGIAGVTTSMDKSIFLGSLYSYSLSGGVGSLSGQTFSGTDNYTIQELSRGGGVGTQTGASAKASALWSSHCISTSWLCGDADNDMNLDSGEGEDIPRLTFEAHPCANTLNTQPVADQVSSRGSTVQNPISLCNIEQLEEVANYPSKFYRLEQDISLASSYISTIGGSSFTGTLDGNHRALHGIIDETATSSYSLFTNIGSSGVIKNLDLANFHVKSTVGGVSILGVNDGTLENIRVAASQLHSDDKIVGGVVHENSNVMKKIRSSASVKGLGHVGGIVGINTGTIVDAISDSTILGSGTSSSGGADFGFAGIAGENVGSIERATFEGSITFSPSSWDPIEIGGIAGHSSGTIIDSDVSRHASFTIYNNNSQYVGGLVGRVPTGAGTHARLISNAHVIGTNTSSYATNKYSPTIGEYQLGLIPPSIVSFTPLLETVAYTTSAMPTFTFATNTCTSSTLTVSGSPANGTSYYMLPYADESSIRGKSMLYNTSPNRLSFSASLAGECGVYNRHLAFYSSQVSANPLTLAGFVSNGFSVGNFVSGSDAEKNKFFAAYLDFINDTKTAAQPPTWIYEDDEFQIFRVDK